MLSVADARVSAVVLTFNRKELLVECLQALLAQTRPLARVHVVDNASTDGTFEALEATGLLERVEYDRLPENRGGAGGFAHGVEVARRDDVEWLWLMDDDSEPAPDCLEALLASSASPDPATVALCPVVRGRDGRVQTMHRGTLDGRPKPLPAKAYGQAGAVVGYATFVGLLVRTAAARRLDPPKGEFFIWVDDYEYCLRLRKLGDLRLVPAAVMHHKDLAPTYANRRSRVFNRLLGWEIYPTPYDMAWRNLCGIRNYVWMKQEHEGLSTAGFWRVVAQFVVKALMYDEKPLRRIPWLVRYARDGRRGLFFNFAPPDWAARARDGRV